MRAIHSLLFLAAFLLVTSHLAAQELRDTLIGVEKKSNRQPAHLHATPNGIKVLSADSATLAIYKNQSVATLLSQQFPVFVRTYGTNGLATLSLRGASAAQTAVRWNGIPLQNGATGLVDLMLIPVSIVDEVSIEYGSSGGRIGSGAVGGTLFLENTSPVLKNSHTLAVNVGAGSYGRLQGAIKGRISNEKWTASIAAFAQQANNDFNYTDNNGLTQQLANGKLSSASLQLSLAGKLSVKNTIEAYVWADKHRREIPPALFENRSVKEQRDAAVRTNLLFSHKTVKQEWGIRASLFDEWFRYSDSLSALRTDIHTRQGYLEPYLISQMAHDFSLSVSLPQQWNGMVGEPSKKILKSALAASLNKRWSKMAASADGRLESINGKIYGAGGINADWLLISQLKLRGSADYTYRAPTLNELYFTPGGNPLLLPEQGWSTEAGYTYTIHKSQSLEITHTTTAFYRDINNWILWFGGAIWTPHNIARVISKGLETEQKVVWTRAKIRWQLSANASVITSQTKESKVVGDGSVGKQIPYAPRFIGQGNIGFTTARWRLNYNQTYTGVRYYNTDETGRLSGFATGNLQAGYLLSRGNWNLDLNAQLQNIWNMRYMEVSGRPAPGINWLAGITISERK